MGQVVAHWARLSRMTAIRRRAPNGHAYCDLCGMVPAQERHHLIPKSQTGQNMLARLAADVDELTTLLCRECHDGAHAPGVREQIFQRLYVINGLGNAEAGYRTILAAFNRVKDYTRLTWELPEPGDGEEEE